MSKKGLKLPELEYNDLVCYLLQTTVRLSPHGSPISVFAAKMSAEFLPLDFNCSAAC